METKHVLFIWKVSALSWNGGFGNVLEEKFNLSQALAKACLNSVYEAVSVNLGNVS